MKELDQMSPVELIHLLFDELKSINQRLDKIEEILGSEKTPIGKNIFTISEAQEYLDLSRSQIYKMTSSRKIGFYKTGKRIYFKREHLDEYLTQNYQSSDADLDRMANEYLQKNPLRFK